MGYPPGTNIHPRVRLRDFDYSDPSTLFLVTICSSERRAITQQGGLPEAILGVLGDLRDRYDTSVYAHCLMPDHIHMLLHLGESGRTLGAVVGAFKSKSTRAAWNVGWAGRLWQARFHDRILRRNETAETVTEYILMNPVRKGLVMEAADWPYSGHLDLM